MVKIQIEFSKFNNKVYLLKGSDSHNIYIYIYVYGTKVDGNGFICISMKFVVILYYISIH